MRKRHMGCPREIPGDPKRRRCESTDLAELSYTKRTGLNLYKRYSCRKCGHVFWRKVTG